MNGQFYLKGARASFQVVTDHFALVALTKKDLGDLPLKLRDLFMELRGLNYTTEYLAGARNIISDSLSRADSQPCEPPSELPEFAEYPMQKISADLFHFGSHVWLILVDWFSNFSFAKKLGQSGSTDLVIKKMKNIILRQG